MRGQNGGDRKCGLTRRKVYWTMPVGIDRANQTVKKNLSTATILEKSNLSLSNIGKTSLQLKFMENPISL